jgi:TcpE family
MRKPVRTYTKIWKYEKILFAIEDFRLPVPIPWRTAFSFIITLTLLVILTRLPLLEAFSKSYWLMILIAGCSSYFFTTQKLEGKEPLNFIRRYFFYSISSKKLNRYQKVEKPQEYRYTNSITFRKGVETDD